MALRAWALPLWVPSPSSYIGPVLPPLALPCIGPFFLPYSRHPLILYFSRPYLDQRIITFGLYKIPLIPHITVANSEQFSSNTGVPKLPAFAFRHFLGSSACCFVTIFLCSGSCLGDVAENRRSNRQIWWIQVSECHPHSHVADPTRHRHFHRPPVFLWTYSALCFITLGEHYH